jgi:beta-galactosidase
VVLPARAIPAHNPPSRTVIERPKVLRSRSTGKFVLWFHHDNGTYRFGHAGIAVADQPTGPFTYLHSIRPFGEVFYDMTLFDDPVAGPVVIFAAGMSSTIIVAGLSPDLTQVSGKMTRNLVDGGREAPAICLRAGRYTLFTSGLTGWNPNPLHIAQADSVYGPWTDLGPCGTGPGAETTFDAQSTHILKIEGLEDRYVFMADRWRKEDLGDSRYVWLPLAWEGDRPVLRWVDTWTPTKPSGSW